MMRPALGLVLAVVASAWRPGAAYYLPGVAPHSYAPGDPVPLFVDRLDSIETALPFEYKHFDFCMPSEEQEKHRPHENLGQIVFGSRIHGSPYNITFREAKSCALLCTRTYDPTNMADKKKVEMIQYAILNLYVHHWIVDNMPVARHVQLTTKNSVIRLDIPVGCIPGHEDRMVCGADMEVGKYYIYNHMDFKIMYQDNTMEYDGNRIVGIWVTPRSIYRTEKELGDPALLCGDPRSQPLMLGAKDKLAVVYTYSTTFEPSQTKWASRWDPYLKIEDAKVHWFSIVNSLIIVLFLTGMVAMIMMRTLHRDIARYNQSEMSEEDAQEEFGWKLVHGDVFRPPKRSMLLSVLAGSGWQVVYMCAIALICAVLGFLSPANRGSLTTALLVLYVLLGTPAGYYSARLYKTMGGERWKSNVLLTATLVPGVVFGAVFLLNLVLWNRGSSAAIPFATLVVLLLMWFGVSAPLAFVGAYRGFRKPPYEHPVRTNQIPRQIPRQSFYMRAVPSMLMGGVLPFGAIFIELFFIISSVWYKHIYYMFGFLALVYVILLVTVSEVVVLLCYFHLCAEDYRWWWRSFLTGGATAFYLFMYSLFVFATKLDVQGAASGFLYFGYTFIVCFLVWVLTGTIGFSACYYFIRRIYGAIKVD